MNHDVFISYSSKNSAAAQAICHELEDKGIKCWMAPRDIPVGAKYASVITKAIVGCRIVVLVFSDDSARSPWVESEINIAFSNRKIIVPYKIDTANIEDFEEFYLMLNNRHWIEAYPDYRTRFKELVTIVAQTLGKKVSVKNTDDEVDFEHQPSKGILIIKADLDCRVFNYGEEIGIAKAGEYTKFELPLGDNELRYVGLDSDEDCYEEQIIINENRRISVKVALLDKYNVRKAKEEAEIQRVEVGRKEKVKTEHKAENECDVKTERENSLLKLPDEAFEKFVENDKFGFKLKSTGEVVIPLKYDDAWGFREGLAMVKLNGKWGFIDKTGKEVIPLKYDYAQYFINGLAEVRLNWKFGFIDKTGKEVIPLKYGYAQYFSEGLAKVKLNGKYGFVDKTGKEVIPLEYDDAWSFSEGLASVKLNGRYGFIDKTGKEVIPLKYDYAQYFSEGLASVKLNGRYGFIDKTGKEVISKKYYEVKDFRNGKALVKTKNIFGVVKGFYIDKNGNRIE